MSALSIRNMKYTMIQLEHIRAERERAEYEARKAAHPDREPYYYWMIYRPAKRGNKKIFVTARTATISEMDAMKSRYGWDQPGWEVRKSVPYNS